MDFELQFFARHMVEFRQLSRKTIRPRRVFPTRIKVVPKYNAGLSKKIIDR